MDGTTDAEISREGISEEILETFAALLSQRFALRVPTTEDAVRYTFFAALLRSNLPPERIVVEYRHPSILNAQVDTVILDHTLTLAIAIEFKYDRAANSTSPKPQKAGALFSDLARLLRFSGVERRYFVHVTDSDMADYLDKPEHGLQDFFRLDDKSTLVVDETFLQQRPPTFHKRMGEWPCKAVLRAVCSQSLPSDHYLRVFEVGMAAVANPR